jgi:hypothetical protein
MMEMERSREWAHVVGGASRLKIHRCGVCRRPIVAWASRYGVRTGSCGLVSSAKSGEVVAPIGGALPNSRCPSITIQHHHDIAFHDRDVGIWRTGPPTNQHPATLLKRLTTGKPPSLFYMHRVTYAPRAPPSTMLGIPDQMGQFVCHSSTPRFRDLRGTPRNTLRR